MKTYKEFIREFYDEKKKGGGGRPPFFHVILSFTKKYNEGYSGSHQSWHNKAMEISRNNPNENIRLHHYQLSPNGGYQFSHGKNFINGQQVGSRG